MASKDQNTSQTIPQMTRLGKLQDIEDGAALHANHAAAECDPESALPAVPMAPKSTDAIYRCCWL